MNTQPEDLINILLDKTARLDERDDAAMDLSHYPSQKAKEALSSIAEDSTEDRMILDSCGESLANIWISENTVDILTINKMTKIAYLSAKQVVKGNKPEWLNLFSRY